MAKDKLTRFIFSGPSTAQFPLHAETEAMLIALKELSKHNPQSNKMIIYTDSSNIVTKIQQYNAGRINMVPSLDSNEMCLLNYVNSNTLIVYIIQGQMTYLNKELLGPLSSWAGLNFFLGLFTHLVISFLSLQGLSLCFYMFVLFFRFITALGSRSFQVLILFNSLLYHIAMLH